MPFLVELAVEPRSRADAERLDDALRRLVAEDGGFAVSQDRETGQTSSRARASSTSESSSIG